MQGTLWHQIAPMKHMKVRVPTILTTPQNWGGFTPRLRAAHPMQSHPYPFVVGGCPWVVLHIAFVGDGDEKTFQID